MKLNLLGEFLILRFGWEMPVAHPDDSNIKTTITYYGFSFAYKFFIGLIKFNNIEGRDI